jgi:hypothetical protein
MTPEQFSAPDPATTAIDQAASIYDIAAYSTAYTQEVLDGSQAIEQQVLSDFQETISNYPQSETE